MHSFGFGPLRGDDSSRRGVTLSLCRSPPRVSSHAACSGAAAVKRLHGLVRFGGPATVAVVHFAFRPYFGSVVRSTQKVKLSKKSTELGAVRRDGV